MANRYTDTDKWDDDWFLSLPPKMKCAWLYLCDTVRGCGERKISLVKLSLEIGDQIGRHDFDTYFQGRVFWLDENTIWVPGTLSRIYKNLSASKVHINAAKKILKYCEGLVSFDRVAKVHQRFSEFLISLETISPSLEEQDSSLDTKLESKDIKNKDIKNKEVLKKGECEGKEISVWFDQAYAEYPVRVKGQGAFTRFKDHVKTPDDFQNMLRALANYKAMLAKPENHWRQPKTSFAIFLGTKKDPFWTDFIADNAGEVTLVREDLDAGCDIGAILRRKQAGTA